MSSFPAGSVRWVDSCDLRVETARWDFAEAHSQAIDLNWQAEQQAKPRYFNGVIHLLISGAASDTIAFGQSPAFAARFLRTDFKSYLYWRHLGFTEARVRDCFGSVILRSREGHVLLGRQRAGNVNAGLAYLPGGFIDARDVSDTGTIDIAASITRELEEETGLTVADFEVPEGFRVISAGPHISIAREFRSSLAAGELRQHILDKIGADPHSELVDIVIVTEMADIVAATTPAYTQLALADVFHSTTDKCCAAALRA